MKTYIKVLLAALFCTQLAGLANAALLGVNPGYPQIDFVSVVPGAVSFNPTNQMMSVSTAFSVNAQPFNIFSSETDPGTPITNDTTLQILIQVNQDGSLASGTNGFTITGDFTWVVDGETNTFSGTLLQGNVTAFGWNYEGAVNQFDFTVQLTGGQLMPYFTCADLLAVTMSSEASSFTGTFTNEFEGLAKGYCGPDDVTAPSITCPPLSEVVTTAAPDPDGSTNTGFIVTYPNPVVTDSCDPTPILFCDTPSGSFVVANPGDLLTITCYGIDVSGNYSTCSFTVVMGQGGNPQGGTCPVAFTDSGCAPVTLSTAPNECYATYSFTAPVATNCMGQTYTATATALNEAGTAITLTNLGSGLFEGVFPRTTTTNGNLITYTASDGHGDQAVQQCRVFVKDTQAPTIVCLNQTATFKPILTNALSCIDADFNSTCVAASNYLWFSSVIQSSSCRAPNGAFTVHIFDQAIELSVDNTNITLTVPDAYVYFSNGVCTATTIFTNGQWETFANTKFSGNTFASGLQWQLPFNLNNVVGNCWGRDVCNGQFRRHVNSATWCARFGVDTPGVALTWQWGAVVESKLSTNCNALCVKPIDDNHDSCWKNTDPAGSCESYRTCLVSGACGRGSYNCGGQNLPDCTGILSGPASCNLGEGIVCEGVVNFTPPTAYDNCGSAVTVTCNPPSGSVFGPGNYTISSTAVDSSGNSNQCSFVLTVLAPLQVVFDSPSCDNIADNTCEPDAGFTDFNCPDAPSATQYINYFTPGNKVCHVVRLLDCNGNDITTNIAPCVTVHIDVCERQGSFTNSTVVCNVPQNYVGIGCPGSILAPCSNGTFQYNLDTTGYQANTCNNSRFFRSCVWVDYNSSPGIAVGMEDCILESQ